MGWLDTPEQRRRQHLQMIAAGSIKDIDRIQERNRRRRINGFLWFLLIISALLGFFVFSGGFAIISYYFFGFALLMLIILIFRYGLHRKIKLRRNKNSWEKIDRLPNWAYKKMKRRRSHIVNGAHYMYKKEGNKFYRKLK